MLLFNCNDTYQTHTVSQELLGGSVSILTIIFWRRYHGYLNFAGELSREVMAIYAWPHAYSKWQNWDSNPHTLAPQHRTLNYAVLPPTCFSWSCPCFVAVVLLSDSLSDPMNCSLPASSVHGIFQEILEWAAISFSRGLLDPGIEPASPTLAGGFFYHWAFWKAPYLCLL